MKRLPLLLSLVYSLSSATTNAQAFINGDLNGVVAMSNPPTNWTQVLDTDPISQATAPLMATSEVTSTAGPNLSAGINGNPYSGTTLVSGLHNSSGVDVWQEGIQQTLTGLTVGYAYRISFCQTVIKQINVLDATGSWAVYMEGTLIGVTAPTTSPMAYNSNSHPWERRTVVFTATASSHVIKFLPLDDDINIVNTAGVRMGIDSITLQPGPILPVYLEFNLSLSGQSVHLDWDDAPNDNTLGYNIERAADGTHFEVLGSVEHSVIGHFEYVDEAPYAHSYYRIAAVHSDGSKTYSDIQSIRTQAPLSAHVHDRKLMVQGGNADGYRVHVRNLNGQLLLDAVVDAELDLSMLDAGIHFLRVTSLGAHEEVLDKRILLQN